MAVSEGSASATAKSDVDEHVAGQASCEDMGHDRRMCIITTSDSHGGTMWLEQPGSSWAEARVKIARVTLTIKLDGNWSSFQLANSAPPLSVTDSAIAPSARMAHMPHYTHTPLLQRMSG